MQIVGNENELPVTAHMRINSVHLYAVNGIIQRNSTHNSALVTLNTGTLAQGVYLNVVHLEDGSVVKQKNSD